jgi:hypothetical protein
MNNIIIGLTHSLDGLKHINSPLFLHGSISIFQVSPSITMSTIPRFKNSAGRKKSVAADKSDLILADFSDESTKITAAFH